MVLLERQSWQWSALSGGRHKENSLMLAQNQRQCTLERKKPTARYALGRKLGLIDQFVVVVNRSSHDILVSVEDDPEATVETQSLKKRAVGCKAGVGVGVAGAAVGVGVGGKRVSVKQSKARGIGRRQLKDMRPKHKSAFYFRGTYAILSVRSKTNGAEACRHLKLRPGDIKYFDDGHFRSRSSSDGQQDPSAGAADWSASSPTRANAMGSKPAFFTPVRPIGRDAQTQTHDRHHQRGGSGSGSGSGSGRKGRRSHHSHHSDSSPPPPAGHEPKDMLMSHYGSPGSHNGSGSANGSGSGSGSESEEIARLKRRVRRLAEQKAEVEAELRLAREEKGMKEKEKGCAKDGAESAGGGSGKKKAGVHSSKKARYQSQSHSQYQRPASTPPRAMMIGHHHQHQQHKHKQRRSQYESPSPPRPSSPPSISPSMSPSRSPPPFPSLSPPASPSPSASALPSSCGAEELSLLSSPPPLSRRGPPPGSAYTTRKQHRRASSASSAGSAGSAGRSGQESYRRDVYCRGEEVEEQLRGGGRRRHRKREREQRAKGRWAQLPVRSLSARR